MNIFDWFPFVGLLLFMGILFVNTIYLKRNGINIKNKSTQSGTGKKLLYPVYLILFHIILFEIGKPVLKISVLPDLLSLPIIDIAFLKIAGAIFIIFSITILIFTLITFGNSFRFGLHSKNIGKLVTKGIFSYSRNPFFLSALVYFLGITLIIPSPFFCATTVLAAISIHLFVLKEEEFMRQNYGEEYADYAKKVRRYL